jgi:hypothetical protein
MGILWFMPGIDDPGLHFCSIDSKCDVPAGGRYGNSILSIPATDAGLGNYPICGLNAQNKIERKFELMPVCSEAAGRKEEKVKWIK